MPSQSTSDSSFTITHISTATAILDINGVKLLTDPAFDEGPIVCIRKEDAIEMLITKSEGPALTLSQLPPIDAILLSHEDLIDNLDPTGRRLLDGRQILTTEDGAKNLAPRPGVQGIIPWESIELVFGGTTFTLTGTPCERLPGGECIGFILESSTFGTTDGLPNAIYFSGDTIYIPDLAQIRDMVHVSAAILNLGGAKMPIGPGKPLLRITMDGKRATKLVRDIGADVIVPMHFESWTHFIEDREELEKVFKEEGIFQQVCWPVLGQPTKVL